MTNFRIGHGYDVHQLVIGRKCIIGGVTIPFEKGLDGHSDADVLLHAICDALLGAAALGDIGKHFPPSDMRYRGINSGEPHTEAMRQHIAADCEVALDAINVKATTTEKLGFTGRGEGIAAEAVCIIQKI
jgi:2-C-methyl-D-erythritol 2,4-cyclodiphosphate synthase